MSEAPRTTKCCIKELYVKIQNNPNELQMSLFVSRPSASNQGAGNRQQKDVSMERALRRLTPTKSPAPLTPRTSSSSLSPQRLSSGGLRKCGLNRSTTKLNGVGLKDRSSGEEAVKGE